MSPLTDPERTRLARIRKRAGEPLGTEDREFLVDTLTRLDKELEGAVVIRVDGNMPRGMVRMEHPDGRVDVFFVGRSVKVDAEETRTAVAEVPGR